MEERLQEIMEGHPRLYLYRDPLYQQSYRVFAPYKHPKGHFFLPDWQKKANERLSLAQIAVKHAFGHTEVR
jgi:hypothetical protein